MTEEEQLEAIKKWWKKHQNKISVVLSTILLITAGYRYWTWHTEKKMLQASEMYERLISAFSKQDTTALQASIKTLNTQFKNTVYSDVAYLVTAHQWVAQQQWDQAKQALTTVIQNSKMTALQEVARLRMARIDIYQGLYSQALTELDKIQDSAYLAKINELKGDVFYATGEYAKADSYYQKARLNAEKQGVTLYSLDMKLPHSSKVLS